MVYSALVFVACLVPVAVQCSGAMYAVNDGADFVTVAELGERIANRKTTNSAELASELEHLRLTQRLSGTKLAELRDQTGGEAARNALMVIADASSFLAPPPDELPRRPFPTVAEQSLILSRVADYLRKAIPKLPDFYATRVTRSFRDTGSSKKDLATRPPTGLHAVGKFKASVFYRAGTELVREHGARDYHLVTEGIFGPVLAIVISDAARSATTEWRRWENGPNGPMAVFRFHVSQEESHYDVAGIGDLGAMGPTAYHGEIGVDPDSGTILRLVLEADPALGSSIRQADVMVEFGSVSIGGRAYICPIKSVSYFSGSSTSGLAPAEPTEQLNDVTFGDYHVFRSQMRILP